MFYHKWDEEWNSYLKKERVRLLTDKNPKAVAWVLDSKVIEMKKLEKYGEYLLFLEKEKEIVNLKSKNDMFFKKEYDWIFYEEPRNISYETMLDVMKIVNNFPFYKMAEQMHYEKNEEIAILQEVTNCSISEIKMINSKYYNYPNIFKTDNKTYTVLKEDELIRKISEILSYSSFIEDLTMFGTYRSIEKNTGIPLDKLIEFIVHTIIKNKEIKYDNFDIMVRREIINLRGKLEEKINHHNKENLIGKFQDYYVYQVKE